MTTLQLVLLLVLLLPVTFRLVMLRWATLQPKMLLLAALLLETLRLVMLPLATLQLATLRASTLWLEILQSLPLPLTIPLLMTLRPETLHLSTLRVETPWLAMLPLENLWLLMLSLPTLVPSMLWLPMAPPPVRLLSAVMLRKKFPEALLLLDCASVLIRASLRQASTSVYSLRLADKYVTTGGVSAMCRPILQIMRNPSERVRKFHWHRQAAKRLRALSTTDTWTITTNSGASPAGLLCWHSILHKLFPFVICCYHRWKFASSASCSCNHRLGAQSAGDKQQTHDSRGINSPCGRDKTGVSRRAVMSTLILRAKCLASPSFRLRKYAQPMGSLSASANCHATTLTVEVVFL